MDEKNKANYMSSSYSYMNQNWQKTMEVYKGVRSMRESSVKYLNQFSKESDEDYSARKKATEFYNVFGGSVSGTVGIVFSSEIVPNSAPKLITELFTDIDLCGTDLKMFLRETFTNSTRDGHSFIFVDAPPKIEIPDNQRPTLADVSSRRPFWINYKANQAINWQFESVNGKSVLSKITFKECTVEPDGDYGSKEVIRYRVLKRGGFSLYREEKNDKNEIVLTPEVEDAPTNLSEIPVVIIYGRKVESMESIPPFMELLETNLTHYNSQSILREALKYIVPMPIFKLDSETDADKFKAKMTVSANRGIVIFGLNAEVSYLELKGESISALRTDIQDLEMRMAKSGVEKFAPIQDGTNKTAFEVGSDNRKEMSEVSVMAQNLETGVEQAFYFTAELINAIKGPNTVNLNEAEKANLKLRIDYDKLTFSTEQMTLFSSLVDTGKLSLKTFLSWLSLFTDMPEGFDPVEEIKQIASEGGTVFNAQMGNGQ